MGGRQGFGPVIIEPGEPRPPARWEAASLVLFGKVLVQHLAIVSGSALRHAVERMDPADYLTASYYERWLTAAATLAVESGIMTRAELEERAGGPYPLSRPVKAETITDPPVGRSRFSVGDRVRVRQWHPPGHTRCPGYVRGHVGVVKSARPHTRCASTPTSCGTTASLALR